MFGTRTVRRGEWTLLLVREPGSEPKSGGVLLLDLSDDMLYVRLRTDVTDLDPDVALVWDVLESDLTDKAAEMGGLKLLDWLQEEGSNTISIGDRQQIRMSRPEDALNELFSLYVGSSLRMPCIASKPLFGEMEIAAAYKKLPISKIVGVEALKACQDPTCTCERLAGILAKDPALSGHLIRLGNLASASRGPEVRSVAQALTRVGFDEAKLHIWASCTKGLYSAQHLRRIWNHSITTVSAVDELCQQTKYPSTAEAKLVALLHDIGSLVLTALDPRYTSISAKLLGDGLYPVEIERRLCGSTHAEIGAELLKSWHFPKDMVEAVRNHHSPSKSSSLLTSLLYCGECWTDNGEDVYSLSEHAESMDRLGLQDKKLNLRPRPGASLNLLRFAV